MKAYRQFRAKFAQKSPNTPGGPPFTPSTRDIPEEYNYDPKALKHLSKALWAVSVALGHALTAQRSFTKIKSSTISPDGLLGGKGYVMGVKDIRERLFQVCENLSAIADTFHDEIQAPHWQPKKEELDQNELEDIDKFVSEAEDSVDSDGQDVENHMLEMEQENDLPQKGRREWSPEKPNEDSSSKLPNGGDKTNKETLKQASYFRKAESSVSPQTLPGPRVDNLDRGFQTGPEGSYNHDEVSSQIDWTIRSDIEDYDQSVDYREPISPKMAESSLPMDTTKTDALDFGIGWGANGGGLDHSPAPPQGKGVWGPSSGLPNDPATRTVDPTTPAGEGIELSLRERDVFANSLYLEDHSFLPNDNEDAVARTDYYDGNKGNQMNHLAENSIEGEILSPLTGLSELPGDDLTNPTFGGRPLPNLSYSYEDTTTPYIRWDYAVHDWRPEATYEYSRKRVQNG